MAMTLIVAIALAGSAVALILRAALLPRLRTSESLVQIDAYGYAGEATAEEPGSAVISGLAGRLGGVLLQRLGEERRVELHKLLLAAGMYRVTPTTFLGYRLLAGAALGVALVWLGSAKAVPPVGLLVLALYGPFFGAMLPMFVLKSRARRRLERIELTMPELIDLLVVTLEAGLSFGAALQRASARMEGPLADEIRLVMREQGLGLEAQAAVQNMLDRCDAPAVRAFVRAIVQSESLGVSIAQLMRELASDLRTRRRQIVEEKAQKAPVKILFPLAFLILPSIFVVLLYPGIHNLTNALGGGA